ncbi:hypothetical protein PMAYCL1PPCAC_06083, partial [Pristionchus mayeri]
SLLFALFNTASASLASEIVKSRDLKRILEYVSPHELVDTVVQELFTDYPELVPEPKESAMLLEMMEMFPEAKKRPPPVEQVFLLKLQLVYWLTTDTEEFEQVEASYYDKFSLFHEFVETGEEIALREFKELSEEKRKEMKNRKGYAKEKIFAIVNELLEKKIASYEN